MKRFNKVVPACPATPASNSLSKKTLQLAKVVPAYPATPASNSLSKKTFQLAKVVPGPATPASNSLSKKTLQLATKGVLKPNSDSLLDQRIRCSSGHVEEKECSAPESKGVNICQSVPIEPVVISKSRSPKEGDMILSLHTIYKMLSNILLYPASTHVHSTVVQKLKSWKEVKEPTVITVTPTLNDYEPEPSLDTSVVISNGGTRASPKPLHTSNVKQYYYTKTPYPLYSTIEQVRVRSDLEMTDVGITTHNSSLLKQLNKRDSMGSVQLISVKRKTGTTSDTVKFPKGTSTNVLAFHYAAASGDKKTLTQIISTLPVSWDTIESAMGTETLFRREGMDVADSEGRTPLMYVAHNNQLQAVKMLVESGAKVNMAALDGSTVLHQAAYSGSIQVLSLLLSLGADGMMQVSSLHLLPLPLLLTSFPCLQDNEGRTPLHWCSNNPNARAIGIILGKVC